MDREYGRPFPGPGDEDPAADFPAAGSERTAASDGSLDAAIESGEWPPAMRPEGRIAEPAEEGGEGFGDNRAGARGPMRATAWREAAEEWGLPGEWDDDEPLRPFVIGERADDGDASGRDRVRASGMPPGLGPHFAGWAPQREPAGGPREWGQEAAVPGVEQAEGPPWATQTPAGDGGHAHARRRTVIREVVETGLLAFLVFLAVRASFQNFKVDGSSMYPTLENGQFLIVNKLVYSEVDVEKLARFVPFVSVGSDPKRNVFHPPERGDIIVLRDPRNPETDLIKRVIGLPGETIEIVQGKVYVNDRLLEEPYVRSPWFDNRPKVLIPEGEYFVMGDNRDNSLDSRSQSVGLVPKDLIIGKALISYWPIGRFGLAPNASPDLTEQRPRMAASGE